LVLLSLLVVAPNVRSEETVVAEPPPKISMRIIFVPFDARTFIPITIDSIDKKKHLRVWFVKHIASDKDHPFVSKVGQMLQAKPAKEEMDKNGVRLKVDLGMGTYYVDHKGTVLKKETGERFQLSPEQMEEIANTLKSFDGVVDVWASEKIASHPSEQKR